MNTPRDLVEATEPEANDDSAPPQVEPTTAMPLANLMQGDEGGDGSTVSTRAQMAAESVLLACRREAAARDEEIDRRNNEQDAERLEISRQETSTTGELRNVAREQRRLASSAEPSPEESSGTSVSLPEATQATTIESARQVTRVAPEVTMDATR